MALETDIGKKQLKDFVKVRMFNDDADYGKVYKEWAHLLFNYTTVPLYVAINSDGEITAREQSVKTFSAQTGADHSKTPEIFQRFLDTTKGKGDPFDFDTGFLPPEGAAKAKR